MADVLLQQQIIAAIREAESESIRVHGQSRPAADALQLSDLLRGLDPRAADVLAWAARTPDVLAALNNVAVSYRLSDEEEIGIVAAEVAAEDAAAREDGDA